MLRWLFLVFLALAALVVDASPLLAAADGEGHWPELVDPFVRATGAYLSPWKIFLTWLVFLAWVQSTDWVSRDSQDQRLRYALWNALVFFVFLLALLLFWILPWFWVGLLLLLIAYVAPFVVYVVYRNQRVTSPSDKVFSRKHLRRWIATRANKIGIKMEGAEIDARDLGPDIRFLAMGAANERDDSINLLTARQSPGYTPSRELLDDALAERASHVMLDYGPMNVAVRYQIDGVWHDRSTMEREAGDHVLEVFKGLAALNVSDRRSRQSGRFGVEVVKEKYSCRISSQGTQSGERAVVQIETQKISFKTLDDLGMRAKMQEQVEAILALPGLFVCSSLPGGGLTTTVDTVLSNADRFVRSFVEVVDEAKPQRDIENVTVTTFSAADGETPATVLPKLVRTYPDVIVVREIPDLDTLSLLCQQPAEKRVVIVGTRAKEAVEALLRLMLLKIPPAEFAAAASGVLNVRLIRKLCEKCKEGYAPPAGVLKQLGLPAGRIEALYRPPTAPLDPKHPEVVCEECHGVGYHGRTAIFELLAVDDDLRNVMTTAPKLENMRAAARKSKHRTLQEEGILLVARGVTSLQELLRVLKQ